MRHDSVDERHFPNASEFEPQRWLVEGAAAPGAGSAKRVAMPFGSGPRLCPGRYLALLEIKLAMAMLLSRFEIETVDTPDGSEAQEVMAFTMNPVGLRMRLRERGRDQPTMNGWVDKQPSPNRSLHDSGTWVSAKRWYKKL